MRNIIMCVVLVLALCGCEGKQGPMGPRGPEGPEGDSYVLTYHTGNCTSAEPDIVHIPELTQSPTPIVTVFASTNTYPDTWWPLSGLSSLSDIIFCYVDDDDNEVAIWGASSSMNYLIIVASPAPR